MPKPATYVEELHAPHGNSARVYAFTAVCIVDEYPRDRPPPTTQQLRDRFGMSRATAYRWRAAICDARGLPRDTRANG